MIAVECYAPTNDFSEDEKNQFYYSLKTSRRGSNSWCELDPLLGIIGDINAKIGNENAGLEKAIGKHGYGKMNENGERLGLDFDLVIGGTLFKHKDN